MIRKNVGIREDQAAFIKANCISLSALLQVAIDALMVQYEYNANHVRVTIEKELKKEIDSEKIIDSNTLEHRKINVTGPV